MILHAFLHIQQGLSVRILIMFEQFHLRIFWRRSFFYTRRRRYLSYDLLNQIWGLPPFGFRSSAWTTRILKCKMIKQMKKSPPQIFDDLLAASKNSDMLVNLSSRPKQFSYIPDMTFPMTSLSRTCWRHRSHKKILIWAPLLKWGRFRDLHTTDSFTEEKKQCPSPGISTGRRDNWPSMKPLFMKSSQFMTNDVLFLTMREGEKDYV